MAFSKPVLEFWAKPYYPLVPAVGGVALAVAKGGIRKARTASGKMHVAKFALAGGILGVAVMLYSRKTLGMPSFGAWGDAEDVFRRRVSAQIDAASLGAKLFSIPSDADDMFTPARDDVGAYFKTAYWLAVAARIEGPKTSAGSTFLRWAKANYLAARTMRPSKNVQAVVNIYAKASNVIAKEAKDVSTARIVQVLRTATKPETIAALPEPKYGAGLAARTFDKALLAAENPWDTAVAAVTGKDISDKIDEGNKDDEKKNVPPWFWPVVVGGSALTIATFIFILSTPRRAAPAAVAA